MRLDEFLQLDETTQAATLATYETLETSNTDLIAERDSLSEENATLREQLENNNKELLETKKLNYTLARNINRKPDKSFDETLLDAMGVKA